MQYSLSLKTNGVYEVVIPLPVQLLLCESYFFLSNLYNSGVQIALHGIMVNVTEVKCSVDPWTVTQEKDQTLVFTGTDLSWDKRCWYTL